MQDAQPKVSVSPAELPTPAATDALGATPPKPSARGPRVVGFRGFAAGFRWGFSGLAITARRPLFSGVGLVMLFLAIGLASWIPVVGRYLAVAAILSGVACAGAAARAAKATPKRQRSPWRAWFAPWSKASAARHVGRVAISAALLAAIAFSAQSYQFALAGQPDPSASSVSGVARLAWGAMCYALLAWMIWSAAPARGVRGSAVAFWRVVRAPMAVIGFAIFWSLWIALLDVLVSSLLMTVMVWAGNGAGGLLDAGLRMGAAVISALAAVALSAPAMAMSAGLASLDLEAGMEPEER